MHEYRPDASTWQQKQEIGKQRKEAQQLKEKVLADSERGQGTPEEQAARLDGYEKEFADAVKARAVQPVVDYGSAGYMADYDLTARPAFKEAASPTIAQAKARPRDNGTESSTPGANKPSLPFGQGSFKI